MRFASWMTVTSLALCAAGASWTLWRRPGVFPMSDGLFWASTATVLLAWLAVLVALVGAVSSRPGLVLSVGLAPGLMLVSGGLAGRLVFPAADSAFFGGPFTLGALWLFTTLRAYRTVPLRMRLLALGGALAAVPLGVVQATARAPLPAETRPLLQALPALTTDGGPAVDDEALRFSCGVASLRLAPFVRFDDASEDGFWPLRRTPVVEKLVEAPVLSGSSRRAALEVRPLDGGVFIEAATVVTRDVAAHLSRFTEVSLVGLREPRLRFDATGDTSYPAATYDYPSGRPVHFAAFTGDALVVWRATSAEKGPFVELGRGALTRASPLGLTVLDGDAPQCHLTFLDFTAQASTQRSPTAGEGVPVNVLQFGRFFSDDAPASLILSLAATGIGSGFETTRHAPGVYRNRIVLSPHEPRRADARQ
ncbi:MAG: hypothetical protein SFW67_17995 [Myxococcaceae bacterium]|nr:hypothetical protein [Myxococcaceae bacterium]